MTVTSLSDTKTTVKLKCGSSFVKIRPFFSYDSKHILLAAGNDIKVLSTSSGECIRCLTGHESSVVGLQTNPQNHTQLISCSKDGGILTWDYLDGICLKKFKVKSTEDIIAFYAPSKRNRVFIVQYSEEKMDHHLRSVVLKDADIKSKFVMGNIVPNEHAVGFGVEGNLAVSIKKNALQIFDLKKGERRRHQAQSDFVCVTCHPSDYIIATGDETGRILVWSNIFDRQHLCRSVYHWHTLPVADLCFSSEGSYLYSGGGECVLVKWNLQRENREFLPRLGMPICHLLAAPDNAFVAVSHVDNGISLVSSYEWQVVQYIQGLSQGHPWSCPGQQLAPTGLIHDPRTGALVMNGRPGHLQFYSLRHDKQLYSVDIVGQNFLTQERNKAVFNTQVEKAAIDPSGSWLSTIQRYDDGQTSQDIVLKVWKYDGSLQTYTLNTTVMLPHYQKVNCLKFRPDVHEEPLLFVTTSKDLSFKTWISQIATEGATTVESWTCESRGHYRDQIPGEASFNQDGTLLAVAFQWTVTLWTASPLVFSAVLSHPSCDVPIRQVLFGREGCSQQLVSRSDDFLAVWDVELRKQKWKVLMKTSHMAADLLSEYMAVFSQDHTLFVFKPSSAEPCFVKEEISISDVIAAAFIPRVGPQEKTEDCVPWQHKSQLYYMNMEQELLTVVTEREDSNEEDVQREENYNEESTSNQQIFSRTGFAALVAQHKLSDVKSVENVEHFTTRGLLGAKQVKELMDIPSNVMPPLRSLCSQFMSALLIPKSTDVS